MKLLVFDAIYIPGYGMGPFITPIEITDPILLADVKRKSRVKVIEDRKVPKKKNKNNTYPISLEESTKVEEPQERLLVEETNEVIEEVVEEVVEETMEEEAIIEEPQEEKVLLTEEDLKDETVAELKARLDSMGVDYLYKDSKSVLIQKVIENQ